MLRKQEPYSAWARGSKLWLRSLQRESNKLIGSRIQNGSESLLSTQHRRGIQKPRTSMMRKSGVANRPWGTSNSSDPKPTVWTPFQYEGPGSDRRSSSPHFSPDSDDQSPNPSPAINPPVSAADATLHATNPAAAHTIYTLLVT